MKTEIKTIGASLIEITGEVPSETLETYRKKAVAHLAGEVKIDGFRDGKVPESVLKQKVGESVILEEMAEMAIQEAYPKIIEENKLDTIGRPKVKITKLTPGNPMAFTIETAVMPEIKLPDYKKIIHDTKEEFAKKDVVVTDTEVETAIQDILKRRAEFEARSSKETADSSSPTPNSKLLTPPVLTDEIAKTLGKFENVAEFKAKLKENMAEEKKTDHEVSMQSAFVENVADKSKLELPELLVEYELNRMWRQFSGRIEEAGLKVSDYLAQTKKSEEDIKKDWRGEAEKRAKAELVLREIAKTEKIEIKHEEIEADVKKIMEMYKDADLQATQNYVAENLQNKKLFELFASF
ncbi:MAG: trigger factor [Candidatus Paceibacterota bacterium]|jgi:trigger factor